MAKLSARWTRNLTVPASILTLATCWTALGHPEFKSSATLLPIGVLKYYFMFCLYHTYRTFHYKQTFNFL